jgi:nucleotide-binding universal stress UspA family protein
MAKRVAFPVLVATDGSAPARAAVRAAAVLPWPRGTQVCAVVARDIAGTSEVPASARKAMDEAFEQAGRMARRALARRWPDATARVVNGAPAEAILEEARRLGARVIVVGSRGYGLVGRLVLGSVSREVVRQAVLPVLVVKGALREVRHVVIALDGSANARRSAAFLAALRAPARARVTLLRVVEPMRLPSMGLLPASFRATLGAEADALNDAQLRAARRDVDATARRLRRAGWTARPVVRSGVPLPTLLETVKQSRANLLVLGARGVGGVKRLLLGSLTEGALTRSPVSVLIVK